VWRHAAIPDALQDTPPFFQHLINTPLSEHECSIIASEIQDESLVVCSDGAHDPSCSVASHGVVFGSTLLQQTVGAVVGPVDGHPKLVTSYRAELSGIVATLYLMYRVCQFYRITTGAVKVYCDNKGALKNAFSLIKEGITPYFKTDHDTVELAQSLIHLIPIAVSSEWVKGHYEGSDKKYQHLLNEAADKIAGVYQGNQRPHHTIQMPLPPPDYRIRLLYDSSVITSG
jgi:ribonuclease HI